MFQQEEKFLKKKTEIIELKDTTNKLKKINRGIQQQSRSSGKKISKVQDRAMDFIQSKEQTIIKLA